MSEQDELLLIEIKEVLTASLLVPAAGQGLTYYSVVADKVAPLILAKVNRFGRDRGFDVGKKQERERIQSDLKPLMAEAIDISDWSFVQKYVQALKEEK